MVPFNLTYLHCLQHSLFEQPFNLYLRLRQPNNVEKNQHITFYVRMYGGGQLIYSLELPHTSQ